jgi:hypothetical protein
MGWGGGGVGGEVKAISRTASAVKNGKFTSKKVNLPVQRYN